MNQLKQSTAENLLKLCKRDQLVAWTQTEEEYVHIDSVNRLQNIISSLREDLK